MNHLQSLRHIVVWFAVCGMCLPTSIVVGNEVETAFASASVAPAARPTVHDVSLAPGGMLVGQVLDEAMQPMRGAEVVILVDGHTAAATTTDANGVFAVTGLRGGVHQVVTGESIENCRLWAPGTAPPRAVSNLRFVPGQGDIVRGQWGPPPSYNSIAEQAKAWATNPWVIAGVVATAVAVPVLLHNLDDDDNGS